LSHAVSSAAARTRVVLVTSSFSRLRAVAVRQSKRSSRRLAPFAPFAAAARARALARRAVVSK
jgi:hypothetical protein